MAHRVDGRLTSAPVRRGREWTARRTFRCERALTFGEPPVIIEPGRLKNN
jgi:hypothetical protein